MEKVRNKLAKKFAMKALFMIIFQISKSIHMSGIFRKCPFCKENAILKIIEPDFQRGVFKRTFKCKNGHEFSEEVSFDEERKWVKEVFEELTKMLY